jgi:hypothetical protein
MEGMAKLVRHGGDLVQGAVEVAEDPRLLDRGHVHAERPAHLAAAHLGVDPSLVKGPPRQDLELRGEGPEVPEDELARLLPREDAIRGAHGGEEVPPRKALLAQLGRLGAEVAPEGREGVPHRREHRLQARPVDVRPIQRGVKAIPAAATPGESVGLPLDAVHGRG